MEYRKSNRYGAAFNRFAAAAVRGARALKRRAQRVIPTATQKIKLKLVSAYRKAVAFLVCLVRIYLRKKVPRSAAQFSFNIIFTLFPMLICLNWLVSALHGSYDGTITLLREFLPESAVHIITDYLEYISEDSDRAILYAGLISMIMPSSAAIRSLRGIFNDIQNTGRRGSIIDFLLSFVYAVILLLVIYAFIFIVISGEWALNWAIRTFDFRNIILGWNWIRFLVLFVVSWTMLYITYRFLPYSHNQGRKKLFEGKVYPGAFFSSITLVVASIIFSLLIGMSARYSLVYGSLASIIIMLLWLYACGNIIMIGCIINRMVNEYTRHSDREKAAAELASPDGR